MVISFPKAGTYLLAKVLQLCGVKPSQWHVGLDRYTDYSNADPALAKSNPRLFDVESPLLNTIQKQEPNSFAVSHLPYNKNTNLALRNVTKIILLRNPYECLSSQMLWELNSKRYLIRKKKFSWFKKTDLLEMLEVFYCEQGNKYIKKYQGVLNWVHCENTLLITYEQLINKDSQIINHLGKIIPCKSDPENALCAALNAKTLTKSNQQIDIMKHPEHAIFKSIELQKINDLVMSITN